MFNLQHNILFHTQVQIPEMNFVDYTLRIKSYVFINKTLFEIFEECFVYNYIASLTAL